MVRKLKLDELGRVDIESYQKQEKLPVVVVLDNIRSGLNVGSIFRTADALAIEKIYLCGITAKPPHREILKTAIGATSSVEWEYKPDVIDCVIELQAQGYRAIGVEQTTVSVQLDKIKLESDSKLAILFGNEVEGLNQDLITEVKEYIEIAQYGTKHSLNVAVCAGIVLWQVSKLMRNT